jgi:hypothetical protein
MCEAHNATQRVPVPWVWDPLPEPDERAIVLREAGRLDKICVSQGAEVRRDLFDEQATVRSRRLCSPGQYRLLMSGILPADLPDRDPRGYDALLDYANRHAPAVSRAVADAAWRLELLSTHEFVNEVLHPLAFRGRTWVVGFNLPFDLSRVAYDDSESRDYLAGGFSLTLRQYLAKDGTWREHRWRSRVALKTIDSKRRLMGFKRPAEVDAADQVPEDGHEPDRTRAFRGHFLDLRTLAFALTNESYSLDRACEDFGVANGKQEAQGHGHIDEAYVDYNRRDVEATGDLFAKLLVEYRRHPIQLSPTKAFSPASVGKAYLRAMGVRPRLDRQPDFPLEVLGQGMVAYYGGRAECRIRRTPVPVVYADFLSMYPTVNSLMGLWDLVTAERVEPATGEEVKCQGPSVSPQGRPSKLPTGGHGFSPLRALADRPQRSEGRRPKRSWGECAGHGVEIGGVSPVLGP